MDGILDGLNNEQRDAVLATEGYVRVVAGAGTGKTRALCRRYAFLVGELGISPGNILCLTFTNKAAAEMKNRITAMLGGEYDTSFVATVHSFCVRILREDISKLLWPEGFIVMDNSDQKRILEDVYEELSLRLDTASFSMMLEKIRSFKDDLEYVPLVCGEKAEIFSAEPRTDEEKIILRYITRQRKYFGLDFFDLINYVIYIFAHFPDVREKWQKRLHYIMVDEFQDITPKEYSLIKTLSGSNKNLFVVGDPDQNIYEWRGSKMKIIMNFAEENSPCETVIMSENYRSTAPILAAANSLIDKNRNRIKKELFTEKTGGELPERHHAKTEADEAEFIVKKIKALTESGENAKNIAVLYRSGYVSRFIEQGFLKENMPYVVWGGVGFYERTEIKDVLSYMRLVSRGDDLSFARIINVPRRKMGKTKLEYLKNHSAADGTELYETLKNHVNDVIFKGCAAREFVAVIEKMRELAGTLSVSELLQKLLIETKYEEYIRVSGDMDRLDNISELLSSVVEAEHEYGEHLSLEEFLMNVSLLRDSDVDDKRERVKLMTTHTAKGLEFSTVFIAGMSDGIFPSSRSLSEREDALEEERRLFFVAMTRAQRRLFITESEGYGAKGFEKIPSRFISDIDDGLLKNTGVRLPKIQNNYPVPVAAKQTEAKFTVGTAVHHTYFGDGTVESIDEKTLVYIVRFGEKTKPISFTFAGLTEIKEAKTVNGWTIG